MDGRELELAGGIGDDASTMARTSFVPLARGYTDAHPRCRCTITSSYYAYHGRSEELVVRDGKWQAGRCADEQRGDCNRPKCIHVTEPEQEQRVSDAER